MDLKELQKNWDAFGNQDAMYAINTRPGMENGGWDVEAFYQTGIDEISRVERYLNNRGYALEGQKALDFGCGIGRLSVALAPYFDEVVGIDISKSMISQAKANHGDNSNLTFILNEVDDLSVFEDGIFDFIYSNITLQHMHPVYSMRYIKEFVRLIKPKGLCLFQLPTYSRLSQTDKNIFQKLSEFIGLPPSYNRQITKAINRMKGLFTRKQVPVMEMYGTPKKEVIKCIEAAGGIIIHIKENGNSGPHWESFYYLIGKGVV